MAKNDTSFTVEDDRASEAAKKQKRGPSLKTSLLKILDMDIPEKIDKQFIEKMGIDLEDKKLRDAINGALVNKGLKGDVQAIREINDREGGKAIQYIQQHADPEMDREHIKAIVDEFTKSIHSRAKNDNT